MFPATDDIGSSVCSQKRGSSPSSQTTARLTKFEGILQTHELTAAVTGNAEEHNPRSVRSSAPATPAAYGVSFMDDFITGDSL